MAINTPLHEQGRVAPHQRHLIHSAVTGDAAHPFFYVNAVIEIYKIGQVVNSRPLNRFARSKTVSHRRELRAVGPDLRMALHADVG